MNQLQAIAYIVGLLTAQNVTSDPNHYYYHDLDAVNKVYLCYQVTKQDGSVIRWPSADAAFTGDITDTTPRFCSPNSQSLAAKLKLVPLTLSSSVTLNSIDASVNDLPPSNFAVMALIENFSEITSDFVGRNTFNRIVLHATPSIPTGTEFYLSVSPDGSKYYDFGMFATDSNGIILIDNNMFNDAVSAAVPENIPVNPNAAQSMMDKLIALKVAEVKNEKSYIDALINVSVTNLLGLTNTDVAGLQAAIAEIKSVVDGDANTPGYQNFVALLDRVSTLESNDAAQISAISALQTAVAGLTSRVSAVESGLASAQKNSVAQQQMISALQSQIGNYPTYDDMQAAAQAGIDELWKNKTRPAGLPNADGSVSV